MIRSPLLRRFLGVDRFIRLSNTLGERPPIAPTTSTPLAVGVLALSLLPASVPAADRLAPGLGTAGMGLLAIVGLLLRFRARLQPLAVSGWRRAFELVHTSFALGCLPAVLVLVLVPRSVYVVQGLRAGAGTAPPGSAAGFLWTAVTIAAWSGATEEIVYRGTLVSFLRRWRGPTSAGLRDLVAVLASAATFGLCHVPAWGWPLGIALAGLGAGLAVGYLASGERLWPVILYHALFNVASLTAAAATHRL